VRAYDTDIIDPPLLRRCAEGDRAALDALIRACQPLAYSIAYRILGSGADAEDATQETFLRAYQHLHRFDHRVRFTTWLGTIATRVCIDKLRQRKIRSGFGFAEEPDAIPADSTAVDDHIAHRDMIRIVHALIPLLPDTQRVVFVLRDIEDFSVDEVCAATGLSRGSVKTNLHYARKELRRRLKHEYHIEEA
jgi:RNA polymerase sigma-70 factor, ECF subfamily